MSASDTRIKMTSTDLNGVMFLLDQAKQSIAGSKLDKEQVNLILEASKKVESEVYLARL